MIRLSATLRVMIMAVTIAIFTAGLSAPAMAASRIPNDDHFDEQWYLPFIGAPEAWNTSLGFEGITIAILDSGVDIDHPDLKDNIWRNFRETGGDGIDNDGNGFVDDVVGWDFVDGDNDPRPEISGEVNVSAVSHGTISAGIAAARGDNGKGIAGVSWQSRIMAIRTLDSDGIGNPVRVAQAVDYAVANGAKIINLSFVGQTYNQHLADTLRRAYDSGVFVIASAGNSTEGGEPTDLDKNPLYPVCFDRTSDINFIYGVAASDENDRKAPFSNFGAGCVDISAPGSRIISTQLYRSDHPDFGEPYGGYYNGTSVAAPMVAGVVALIWAMDYTLTPRQIQNILLESSFNLDALNPEYFGKIGRGRIDAAKAVHRVTTAQKAKPTVIPKTTASLMPTNSSGRVIVTAPGAGRAPEIRVFTDTGLFLRSFLAYPETFRGGTSLAIGRFSGSARNSIVTGALAGGAPHVRIFDINSRNIGAFYAYDSAFRGGVELSTGDIDGDGLDEIITGAGPGGGPHVRMFSPKGVPVGGFFAFDESFRGGVDVASGDLDGDGTDEVIVGSGAGRSATVRIYDGSGRMIEEFMPYGPSYRGGLSVESRDLDGDGRSEIVATPLARPDRSPLIVDGNGEGLGQLSSGAPVRHLVTITEAADPVASLPGFSSFTAFGDPRPAPPVVTVVHGSAGPAMSFYAYEPRFSGRVSSDVVTIR